MTRPSNAFRIGASESKPPHFNAVFSLYVVDVVCIVGLSDRSLSLKLQSVFGGLALMR